MPKNSGEKNNFEAIQTKIPSCQGHNLEQKENKGDGDEKMTPADTLPTKSVYISMGIFKGQVVDTRKDTAADVDWVATVGRALRNLDDQHMLSASPLGRLTNAKKVNRDGQCQIAAKDVGA